MEKFLLHGAESARRKLMAGMGVHFGMTQILRRVSPFGDFAIRSLRSLLDHRLRMTST